MNTPYRDAVAADSPVLHLSRAVDGTTWRNEVSSNHATLTNGAAMDDTGYTTDDDAARCSLDGDDDRATVSNHAAINPVEAITIEAIIEPTGGPSSGREVIVCKGSQASNEQFFLELSGTNNDRVQFGLYKASDGSLFYNNVNQDAFPVDRGRRNHIVARWAKAENGGVIDFWINGVYTDGTRWSDTYTGDLNTTTRDLLIGSMDGEDRNFGGYIAEVAIYDTYLSDARIEAHHEAALQLGDLIDTQFGDGVGEERYSVSPNHRGLYHDGSRYWVGYANESRFKLLSGRSLDNLTDHGDVMGDEAFWEGLSGSFVFGRIGSKHYCWITGVFNIADPRWITKRFDLSSGTPTQDGSITASMPTGNGHMFAWPKNSAGGEVTAIYAMRHRRDNNLSGDNIAEMHMRVFEPDLSDSTDGGTWETPYGPATGIYAPLSDGVIAVLNDEGGATDASIDNGILEITMPSIGGAQTQHFVTGSDNQAYAPSSTPSFHGSEMSGLLRVGTDEIWMAYVGDEDTDNNMYGLVNLWRRGSGVAGEWTRLSSDLFGEYVYHFAMTQTADGKVLHFAYIPAEGDDNLRGRTLWHRTYTIASGKLSDPTKLAELHPGATADVVMLGRMLGRRFSDVTLPVVWTEHDGTINGGVNTGGNTSIYATSVRVRSKQHFHRNRVRPGVRRMGPETMGRL